MSHKNVPLCFRLHLVFLSNYYTFYNSENRNEYSTVDGVLLQGRRQRGARAPCPPIVDRMDFLTEKNWLCWDVKVTLFSLPEMFCWPQICEKYEKYGPLKF